METWYNMQELFFCCFEHGLTNGHAVCAPLSFGAERLGEVDGGRASAWVGDVDGEKGGLRWAGEVAHTGSVVGILQCVG